MGLVRLLWCPWLLALLLLIMSVAQSAVAYHLLRGLGSMHFITQFFIGCTCFLSGVFRLAIVTSKATGRGNKMATCEQCLLWLAFWGQFVALALLVFDRTGLWRIFVNEIVARDLAQDTIKVFVAPDGFSLQVQTALCSLSFLACGCAVLQSCCPLRTRGKSLDITTVSGHWVFDPSSPSGARPLLQPAMSDASQGSQVSCMRADAQDNNVRLKAYRHFNDAKSATRSSLAAAPGFPGLPENEFRLVSFERTSQRPMTTFLPRSVSGQGITRNRSFLTRPPQSTPQQIQGGVPGAHEVVPIVLQPTAVRSWSALGREVRSAARELERLEGTSTPSRPPPVLSPSGLGPRRLADGDQLDFSWNDSSSWSAMPDSRTIRLEESVASSSVAPASPV